MVCCSDMIDFEDVEWFDEDEASGAEPHDESSDHTIINMQPFHNVENGRYCCHDRQQNSTSGAEIVEIRGFKGTEILEPESTRQIVSKPP